MTPELVIFSLFDDSVSETEKKMMTRTFLQTPKPQVFAPGKPGQPYVLPITRKLRRIKPSLSTFISPRSWLLFHLIDADTRWLRDDPSSWPQNPTYIHLQEFCKDILVVNDAAERAVKDVQDFANMTRDVAHRMISLLWQMTTEVVLQI